MIDELEVTRPTGGRWKRRDVLCIVAGVVALALVVGAASTVSVPVESDLGLVAVLPFPFWIGVLILNIAFFVALRGDADGPARRLVMMSLLVVFVLVLFGTPIFVTDVPRGEVAFRHLGVSDALSQVGVDPGIDAYFNWPGFFALLATMLAATGLDPVTVALWAPVVNVGLWLTAVGAATRFLTSDPRRRWLVLWLFCLGNWQDQDYLSPQAFGFFLYLVLIGLLVGPLGARPAPFRGFRRADLAEWWRGRAPADSHPGHRVGALVVALLLIVVICASHQLTPFMMLVAITALTLSGRVWPSRLPLIAGIVLVLWLVYPASPYLVGHPPLEDAGLGAAITSNVVDRVSGTPGHVVVVQLRVLLTIVLWSLAAAGAVRDWRRGRLDLRVIILAFSPVLIFPVQMYGGEMLIRVSLFALPFIALQACSILLPTEGSARPSSRATGALVLTCFLLAALTVTGRFGNAQYDVFADSEIAAMDAVEEMAPPDSAIISAAHPTPWREDAYLDHQYRTIEDLCQQDLTPATCAPTVYEYARRNAQGAYLVLMSSGEASLVIQGDTTAPDFAEMERWLRTQEGVQLSFRNAHVRVYEVVPE